MPLCLSRAGTGDHEAFRAAGGRARSGRFIAGCGGDETKKGSEELTAPTQETEIVEETTASREKLTEETTAPERTAAAAMEPEPTPDEPVAVVVPEPAPEPVPAAAVALEAPEPEPVAASVPPRAPAGLALLASERGTKP